MAPKTTSSTSQPPVNSYLEKQARMTPARLESLWDNWHSQAERSSPSSSYSPLNTPPLVTSEQYTPNQPSLESSARVGTGKRWGLLKTKPKLTETSSKMGKETKMRENPDRSMFEKASTVSHPMKLRKKSQQKTPDRLGAPSMQASHSVALPKTPRMPHKAVSPNKFDREYFQSSDSAIYFTVDPNWDASKKATADVFLLTDVPTYTVPHAGISQRGTTVVTASEPVKDNRGRSFLILE
ncbi:hypothetical protein H2248_008719 [Termitomyces sp. 'cryptogamus']|nr:hypothetical protein H2248_008719 [Termitomyces sp. 'cryptogamus']